MITIEFLRTFKIGEYALFDMSVSFLGVWIAAPLLSKLFRKVKLDIPRISWILFMLPLSILVHILVAKFTPMTKYFLDPSGHYLLKIFVLVLLVVGITRIKVIKK